MSPPARIASSSTDRSASLMATGWSSSGELGRSTEDHPVAAAKWWIPRLLHHPEGRQPGCAPQPNLQNAHRIPGSRPSPPPDPTFCPYLAALLARYAPLTLMAGRKLSLNLSLNVGLGWASFVPLPCPPYV